MIKKHRAQWDSSTRRLKRARRLYVFFCRHAILASTDDSVVERVSERMMRSGLYAKHRHLSNPNARYQQSRDYRYRVARWLFNIERGSYGQAKQGDWTRWLNRNGFNWNFHKVCAAGSQERQAG